MPLPKDTFTAEEVERMINDARTQMQIETLEKDFNSHKETEEKVLSKILAKLDLVMENEQIRTRELTEFRVGLKEEFSQDFVTKEEFISMKRSIVLAVALVVGAGGVIQWILSTYTMALKISGVN